MPELMGYSSFLTQKQEVISQELVDPQTGQSVPLPQEEVQTPNVPMVGDGMLGELSSLPFSAADGIRNETQIIDRFGTLQGPDRNPEDVLKAGGLAVKGDALLISPNTHPNLIRSNVNRVLGRGFKTVRISDGRNEQTYTFDSLMKSGFNVLRTPSLESQGPRGSNPQQATLQTQQPSGYLPTREP